MSGFSRVRTQRRELLASGRLFGLRRSGGALVPAFSRVTVQTAGVPAEAKRMVVSASGDLYLSSGSMIYRSTASVNTMFMFSSGFAVPPYFVKLYDDGIDEKEHRQIIEENFLPEFSINDKNN